MLWVEALKHVIVHGWELLGKPASHLGMFPGVLLGVGEGSSSFPPQVHLGGPHSPGVWLRAPL